ncbi:MAG: hypothetical protein QXE79_01055 [Candidatus Bathyarchaeia archaeon]
MSVEIKQLRGTAIRIARELLELNQNIQKLEEETSKISRIMTKLDGKEEIETKELKPLGLEDMSPLFLKMRLKGLLNIKREKLTNLQIKKRSCIDALQKITLCPACGGQGEIADTKYERIDGVIYQDIKVRACHFCNGTGKIELGDDVMNLIKRLLN